MSTRSALKGLTIKSFAPERTRVQHHGLLPHGGAHHHVGAGVLLLDGLEGLQPVHVGHGDVHDDQIGLQLVVLLYGIGTVHRLIKIGVAVFAQGILEHLSHERGIVNQ